MKTARSDDGRFAVALLAGALGVRLLGLGTDDLWSDEVHTYEAVARPLSELVSERLSAGHFPIYFVMLKAWASLFGDGHLALRLPSALLGTLLVVPSLSAFRRLLGPSEARWAAALLAFHPLWVELSREARMYPLLGCAFLVTLDGAVASLESGRVRKRFWIGALLGPLVHPTWIFGLVPLAVWLRNRPPSAANRRALLRGCVLSLLVLAASALTVTAAADELMRRPWPREIAVYAVRQVAGSGVREAWTPFYGVLCVAWGMAVLTGLRRAAPEVRTLGCLLVVGVHGLCALLAGLGASTWGPARYVALGVVGLCLLAGAGVGGRRRAWVLAAFVAASLGVRFLRPAEVAWSELAATLATRGVTASEAELHAGEPGAEVVLRHYLAHPRDPDLSPR